jgi:hypothetical protein
MKGRQLALSAVIRQLVPLHWLLTRSFPSPSLVYECSVLNSQPRLVYAAAAAAGGLQFPDRAQRSPSNICLGGAVSVSGLF